MIDKNDNYCGSKCAICGVECDKRGEHQGHLHEDWCELGVYEGRVTVAESIYPVICCFCKSDNISIENAVPDIEENLFHIFVSCNECSKYYRVSLEM